MEYKAEACDKKLEKIAVKLLSQMQTYVTQTAWSVSKACASGRVGRMSVRAFFPFISRDNQRN